jgi:uncharacterized protein YfaS (alpha-2-macroglobulin family)
MKYLFLIIILMAGITAFPQKNYEKEWARIDSVIQLDQPETARPMVDKIYQETLSENNAPQFLKASIYRMKLVSDIEEDFLEKIIAETEKNIEDSKFPVSNILHSMIAEIYWNYYQTNRWKFLNRTEIQENPSDDISTWDLRTIVSRCIDHYRLSLTDPENLKIIPVDQYDAILVRHIETRNLRPTLYDFLAHRPIDFYMSSESRLTQPASKFLINNASYYADAKDFTALNIISQDPFSFEYQAIRLLQELLAMHISDKDPSALVDADLKRLKFVHQHCTLPKNDSLFLASLRKLENRYKDHSSSTDVSYEIANQLVQNANDYKPLVSDAHKWELKEAKEIAEAAISRFPDTQGSNNCKAIIEQIEPPSLDITSEYAAPPQKPALALVTYKNISKLYFRLLNIDPEKDRKLLETKQEDATKEYLTRQPLKSWSADLQSDGDLQSHSTEISLPALDNGFYILLSSPDENFANIAPVSLNRFWRTNISYVTMRSDEGDYDIYVLDRYEGSPVANVKVQQFFRNYNYSTRRNEDVAGEIFTTDKSGFVKIFPISNSNNNQYYLSFTNGSDRFITESYFYNWGYAKAEPKAYTSTYFFTDRAIYRPAQTVYFKGIVIEKKGDDSRILPKQKTTVTFFDANGQKVSSLDLVTNEFGSFSGSFTAPQGVLTGLMSIQCETGSVSFRVEEYKRPKFEVTFIPMEGEYKLGETITVSGKATAYAGNAVSDGQVNYRVVRKARFPYMWWGWRDIYPSPSEMEIINGTTTTDDKGEFNITFTVIPDYAVEKKFDPVFTYTIYADVADINGEVQSGETAVSVGYKSLIIYTDLAEQIDLDKTVTFNLKTANLNNRKVNTQGVISIWKLEEPSRLLRDRRWNRPDVFTMTKSEFEKQFPLDIYDNEGDMTTWAKEKQVFTAVFDSEKDSVFRLPSGMIPGHYIVEISAKDSFGETTETKTWFTGYSAKSSKVPGTLLSWVAFPTDKAEPGDVVSFMAGSKASRIYAIYETANRTERNCNLTEIKGLEQFKIPVSENDRGNFMVNLAFVKYNRSFLFSKLVNVPYTNKKLDISIGTFRDKLEPGQEEEWQITIKDAKGEKAAAELLAGMYDASLDAFVPHTWTFNLLNYFGLHGQWDINAAFITRSGIYVYKNPVFTSIKSREYERLNWFWFPPHGGFNPYEYNYSRTHIYMAKDKTVSGATVTEVYGNNLASNATERSSSKLGEKGITPEHPEIESQLLSPKIRTDFNETAFFYPKLSTNKKGEVVLKFKMPESLTRWKMMGLAYTKDLKVGQIEKTLVTQKDLMVFPNAPRFFRESDTMQFSVKISNISEAALSGSAELHFFDAITMYPMDDKILLETSQKAFTVDQKGNTVLSWKITIPEGLQAVFYRATASSGTFSDGEEAPVPVLTNRMLVTESLPLPVKGNQTKQFAFDKLIASGNAGSTLRNYRLTLEFTSNPAWYAVQALPYLMEYPYECAEQLFSRFYANSIATFIANSDPKIKRVFESWKNNSPDALKSNLEKNQELKSILLEESPWVREAANESERKQRIAVLFDLNKMSNELSSSLKKLREMQSSNGGWPWFKGMPDSRYITQHIVAGLGHLTHLGINDLTSNSETRNMLESAIQYLDDRITEDLADIKKRDSNYLKNNYLNYDIAQYLYARTYFLETFPVKDKNVEAFNFFKNQASTYWKKQENYMKGMLALALNRLKVAKTPQLIMRSLSETALHNEETCMYWRNEPRGWFWYQAPIETQAMLIEAYDEVMNDQKSVEELKVWLLRQKQTQDWKTTRATTEAVYALLLRGTNLLSANKPAEIQLGNITVNPEKLEGSQRPEAGTGYFKTSWDGGQITPSMGKVTVTNPNNNVAWGALYWQYFEQLDKITTAGSPLKVSKQLFREVNTATGPLLETVTEDKPISVGDKVVVRVELRSDRDMEYIHLKDMRAAGFEPVNVLSGYRWQDGLGYYEATRDASANFFISYLPKGTYVFEYKLNATQKGVFSNGITTVQCMYAPEFSAHTEGIRIKLK